MRQMRTHRGYDLFECASAVQKAIRRNDPKVAGYFALEMLESGFHKFVWKRVATTSAEDCAGIVTQEITALWDCFNKVNEGKREKKKGRIFLTKAVLLLCQVPKSRDPDHFQNFVYDEGIGMDDEAIDAMIAEVRAEKQDIPDYALDVHTRRGKTRGATKEDFFRDEHAALEPRQAGLFDEVIG